MKAAYIEKFAPQGKIFWVRSLGVACIGAPFGLLAFEAINIYKLQVIFDKWY